MAMSLDYLLTFVPAFVLAFFRIGGMLMAAPILGSSRVPQRIRLFFALAVSTAAAGYIQLPSANPSIWEMGMGVGSELIFGLAMGMALSLVFTAAQWAGDIIGQQMGLGMGQIFDPQSGPSGAVIGDLYYMLTMAIFLIAGGHRAFMSGVLESFYSIPPMSVGMNLNVLDVVLNLLMEATTLAMRLSGPIIVSMLAVDVVLGFLGRTMPQMNVMTAGLSMRSMLGIIVLIFGLSLSTQVIRDSVMESLHSISQTLW